MQLNTRARAQVDLIRLLVDDAELIVDGLLLAEVLGDGDAADGLLDGELTRATGALRAPHGLARDAAERQRDDEDDRRHGQRQQRQTHVDVEQHARDQHDQQQLAEQVERQRHDRGEVLGVGGDAADDLAGGILVVERHVALHHRFEGITATAAPHRPPRAPSTSGA